MQLQKKLLTGMFWVLLLNLLIKPFWILGIEVGVQNAVGEVEYGLYYGIFSLAYIFNILLDLGVTNFNTRNIARHPHLISKHLGGVLCIKLLLLALYVVVTLTAGLLLGYDSRQFYLLAFLCLNQFLNSLILYLRSNFEGLLLFRWDSVISILDRVVMILICGALLWLPGHPGFRIEYFVYAQTAAYLLTALVSLAVLLARMPRGGGRVRLRFSKPFALAILKQSLPFALLALLMASYNRIDPVLLQRLIPDGTFQSGIYAKAFRLLDALTMIAYLVSVPLLPIFARLTQTAGTDRAELTSTTRLVTSLMLVFSVTAALLLASLDEPLMALLYDRHTHESAAVFRILIFGIIPISMTYVYGTLLTAAGRLRWLNILAATTLVINVAVNLCLIPRMGAAGSAWASLSAQSFMAVTQMVVALKIFHLRPRTGYIIKIMLFTLLITVLCRLALLWWVKLLLVGAAALLLAVALKLIDVKEIATILKHKGQ